MTDAERREAARQFVNKWNGKGKEDEDDRSYWFDLLQNIMGIQNVTDHVEFQKKVIVDGNTKRIDVYIPETKVLIEQKSLGIGLDKKGHQSGDVSLTPYEQAKRYNDNLPYTEKARWIITSNFEEIWIYDMDARVPEPVKLRLTDLQSKFHMLDFLVNEEKKKITKEMELSIKAGELVGKIHDRFQDQYTDPFAPHTQKSLNILCVRLVFLLYAEDVGLFGKDDSFIDYIKQYEPKDIRRALLDLFKVLDTPVSERDPYLEDELAAFPYVNGGLFQDENIVIPKITAEIKQTLIDSANFDWSRISPTIFGAVFESTLNPETRRSGGMHYTSIENIHKVIDPLFLDDLKKELQSIQATQVTTDRIRKLEAFQDKLASLKWLDPAAGSGNFLTETYICIRRLENEVIKLLLDSRKKDVDGQIVFGQTFDNLIKVSISQFWGIEINDFAVTVARTALWISESQMMRETEDIVHMQLNFLPLKTNAYIVEGNALRLDWNRIVPARELNYIMGNPPFVGARLMSSEQKTDVLNTFGPKWKNAGNLDYVSCWYKKAVEYMRNTDIRAALVSTNSISQGESVAVLWERLFHDGIHFNFAYKTFIWDSEANTKAHVYCVIIGFSFVNSDVKYIYENDGTLKIVHAINGYLVDAPDVFIKNTKKPIQDVPKMDFGSMPNDGGNLSDFDDNTRIEILKKYPIAERYFKRFVGATEFLHNKSRWCLWLQDAKPSDIKTIPPIMEAVRKTKELRENSNREATKKLAERPMLFGEIRQPDSNYLIIPRHSSENRRYIPIGYVSKDIICGDANMLVADSHYYTFGILTSNVHMSWMRAVCGRLEMRYRYSATLVYNNFPWPSPTEDQKAAIEKTAQGILEARAMYPDSSLADLYDELTMPPELRKAHVENDKAVMKAYGFDIKSMSEADCVAELMKMYQKLTEEKK